MSDRKALVLGRLAAEGQKTADYLRSLRPADWEQPVYTTGGRWRVREVLAHFVSAEETFAFYGRDILAGGEGAPEGFVIDEFNETQVGGMADRDPAELIADFEQRAWMFTCNFVNLHQEIADLVTFLRQLGGPK
ncbi:MAG: maleylpyruvate isomerase N-terminal domain-containing protein [Chloroflexi bacterium]|nr:maleylpyruvate isomerase N-terminal domain-containing protein [Chloroflexota bacterium]